MQSPLELDTELGIPRLEMPPEPLPSPRQRSLIIPLLQQGPTIVIDAYKQELIDVYYVDYNVDLSYLKKLDCFWAFHQDGAAVCAIPISFDCVLITHLYVLPAQRGRRLTKQVLNSMAIVLKDRGFKISYQLTATPLSKLSPKVTVLYRHLRHFDDNYKYPARYTTAKLKNLYWKFGKLEGFRGTQWDARPVIGSAPAVVKYSFKSINYAMVNTNHVSWDAVEGCDILVTVWLDTCPPTELLNNKWMVLRESYLSFGGRGICPDLSTLNLPFY